MGVEMTFLSVMYSVLQMAIIAFAGIVLYWTGVLDSVGSAKTTKTFYYVLIPVYSFLTIAQAIDSKKMVNFGLAHFSFVSLILISMVLTYICAKLFSVDLRVIRSFVLTCAFHNAIVMPANNMKSSCNPGGPLHGQPECKDAEGEGYISYTIPIFNISFWLICPVFASLDKITATHVKRMAYVIKKLGYNSVNDFLSATSFTVPMIANCGNPEVPIALQVDEPPSHPPPQSQPESAIANHVEGQADQPEGGKAKQNGEKPTETQGESLSPRQSPTETGKLSLRPLRAQQSEPQGAGIKPKDPLEDKELTQMCAAFKVSAASLKALDGQYQKLREAFGEEKMAVLEDPLKNSKAAFKLTRAFIIEQIVNPPIIGSVLGLICGLIPGFKSFFFAKDTTMTMFVDTFKQIGGMAIPSILFTMGAKFAAGIGSTTGSPTRRQEIIIILILKYIVCPALGIGMMYILISMAGDTIHDNKVLFYAIFLMWTMPPALMHLSSFLLVDHYIEDCVYILFWSHIIALGGITLWVFVMLVIFY